MLSVMSVSHFNSRGSFACTPPLSPIASHGTGTTYQCKSANQPKPAPGWYQDRQMRDSSRPAPRPALRGILVAGQQLAAAVSTAQPPARTGGALGWLAEVSTSPIVRPGGLKTARCG